MITSFFVTLAGLVGVGGVASLGAFFVPTVAALLKSALDFLRSPFGMVVGVLALVGIVHVSGWIGGDIHGSNKVRAAWRADTEAQARAALSRELALQAEMKSFADRGVALDLTFSKSIDQKVQDYVAKTPSLACRRATRDDIGRLLSIR
jgi:hypothetical protein